MKRRFRPAIRTPWLPFRAGWLRAALLVLCLIRFAQGAEAQSGPAARPEWLTPAEKRWLDEHPVIRIAPTQNYQPVEFLDEQGRFWGITSEYFNLIEQRLGYRFRIVSLSREQWLRLDPKERGADVITASTETPQRAPHWSFTRPYLQLPAYIITRQGAEDDLTLEQISGARVAAVEGWAVEEFLRSQHPRIIVDPVPDVDTALRKVSFGLVDAFVSELPVATSWLEKNGITNLKIAGESGFTYRLGIGVRKDWPELLGILDKALATITPQERTAVFKRWVKMPLPPSNERLKRYVRWSAVALLVVLAAGIAWNRTLALQVRARTASLRASEERFATAFHSSPIPISLTTLPEGVFLDMNPAFTATFGYTREDCLGRTTGDLEIYFRPEDRMRLREALQTRGGVRDWELAVRHKDGRERVVLYSGQKLRLAEGNCILSLAQDITERRRSEAERQELLVQLMRAEDEERRRIARELHDTTAQHLAATRLNLDRLRSVPGLPASATPLASDSLALVEKSVQEIRTLTYLLHPPLLDELGLPGALRDYTSGFARRSGLRVEVDASRFSGRLPPEMELALFRIVQESLANVHRHSGSATALVRLARDEEEVRVEIQDAGRGLPGDVLRSGAGVGLRGMRERLRQLGGALDIESDGEGTTVLASVPWSEPSHEKTPDPHR